MTDEQPVVFLLHGDDEVGISQFVQAMMEKMGDPSNAQMNITRLEGGSATLGEIQNAVLALPFLSERRLVILDHPAAARRLAGDQEKLLALLDRVPPSCALVILEDPLGEKHWLIRWGERAGPRSYLRAFRLPKGAAFAVWIRKQAAERGGEFTPRAAHELANLVAGDNRSALQEIEKLLAYVNYARPVDVDDVDFLTASSDPGNVFAMVDSIGQRNGRVALEMLHRQLNDRDPLSLFGMIVRQFRLLLLTKELLSQGATQQAVASELDVRDFVARKLIAQARNFTLPTLEEIYLRLGEIDASIKTGKIEPVLALDTLIAGLTQPT